MAKRSGRKEVAISAGGDGGASPPVLRGARTIRTLSARYIADLQDHWEIHGKEALDEYRDKFVDRYVENYAMLARIIRVEADVKHSPATPKTVDEALAERRGIGRARKQGRHQRPSQVREVLARGGRP